MLDHQGIEELMIYWLDHNELKRTPPPRYTPFQNEIEGATRVDMDGLTQTSSRWTTHGGMIEMYSLFNEDDVIEHYTALGYEYLGSSYFGQQFLYRASRRLLPNTDESVYALLTFGEGHTHIYLIAGNEIKRAREAYAAYRAQYQTSADLPDDLLGDDFYTFPPTI